MKSRSGGLFVGRLSIEAGAGILLEALSLFRARVSTWSALARQRRS